MKFYNSITRQVEEFKPLKESGEVGVYTCGPTVYSFVTIGNWRTYTLGDLVVRTLGYLGYKPKYVMNITDVGHLTGDNLGDADTGEDRLEKAAKKEGKTAWDVANFYTDDFLRGFEKLGLIKPEVFCKATDHIPEQIAMVQAIEKAGFAYKIDDGIYFDTKAYETKGNRYGELSTLDEIKAGARVEENKQKRDPRDFALWKFSPKDEKRQMEWESPWGVGFPGWHIECSAMSTKYLGDQFDVHIGGEDLRSTHHPNEIAQAEAATGKKPFVKYWLHGAFLQVDNGRMGKSLGNAYTISDVEAKGYSALDLRYFYLTGHYRKPLNFTWEALAAAKEALRGLRELVARSKAQTERSMLSDEKLQKVDDFRAQFKAALEDDLNMPQALAVAWSMLKSNIPSEDKFDLAREFDSVLSLDLERIESLEVPEDIKKQLSLRDELRAKGDYVKADEVRNVVENAGYVVEDTPQGSVAKKR
jgi:cysteinyl-tRNA synthetase